MGTRILPSPSDSRVGRPKAPTAPTREATSDVDAPSLQAHAPRRQPRWTTELLPLATSIALHAGIVAIGFATYQTIRALAPVVETQTTFGDSTIEPAEADALPGGGAAGPRGAVALPDLDESPVDAKWDNRSSLSTALAGETPVDANTMIGVGPNAVVPSGIGGPTGPARAPRLGLGDGVSFADIPGRPVNGEPLKRVAYVCDATGTMLGLKFELLKQQLVKSIDALKPVQSFNVIFFRGGSTDGEWAMPLRNALLPATPANKAAATKFLSGTSVLGNGTNPLPALRQAFAQRPQVVYFLTDGEFNNFASYDDVVAEVAKMNAGGAVQVNTILLMSDDAQAEAALRKIATAHRGTFKKVSDADLRGR